MSRGEEGGEGRGPGSRSRRSSQSVQTGGLGYTPRDCDLIHEPVYIYKGTGFIFASLLALTDISKD